MRRRSRSYVLAIIAVQFAAVASAENCWFPMGAKTMFGSYEQGLELKTRVEANATCKTLGISWQIDLSRRGGQGTRYSFLVWDSEAQSLNRVHVHVGLSGWESWGKVTRQAIVSEDYGDGFDFGRYRSGSGRAPLTQAEKTLVRQNDKAGRFKNAF